MYVYHYQKNILKDHFAKVSLHILNSRVERIKWKFKHTERNSYIIIYLKSFVILTIFFLIFKF